MMKFDGNTGGDEVFGRVGEREEGRGAGGEDVEGAGDVNYLIGDSEDTELDGGG